jgi:hypothetical protein
MSKSLEEKITETARSVEPSPHFREKLWHEMQRSAQPARAPRWHWLPAAALTALVVVVLAVSPQQVWASLRGLFDFLPDIGLVQNDESNLYLYEPVSQTQDGATLTIQQLVSDGSQTVVAYQIEGLPENGQYCSYNVNRLLLPDGKELLPTGGGLSNEGGIVQARIQFFALPAGVTQATLHTALDGDDPEISTCIAPKEWNVDFTLGTEKPAGMELLPVVESTASSQQPEEAGNSGVKISIDKSVALDDGYILYGSFQLSNPNWQSAGIDFETITAQDAAGREIPLESEDVLPDPNGFTVDNVFALKVPDKNFTPPLTLHVQNLWIMAVYNDGIPVFSFDAGSDPQLGQNWEINKEVTVDGIRINFKDIEVVEEPTDQGWDDSLERGYAITVTESSAQDFSGSYFCEGQGDSRPDYGTAGPSSERYPFIYYYSGGLPYGSVTCSLFDAHYLLPGNWQIDWQPPLDEE